MTDWIRKTKNPKSSIVEIRVVSCKECGEDFCDSSLCTKLTYENFFRPQPSTSGNVSSSARQLTSESQDGKSKKKRKKRKKGKGGGGGKRGKRKKDKTTSQIKNRFKKSIFNRPISKGCTREHSKYDNNNNNKRFPPFCFLTLK